MAFDLYGPSRELRSRSFGEQGRRPSSEFEPAAGGNAAPWLSGFLTRDERSALLITVHDGHPLTLAALGGALSMRMANLGATTFGQAGSPEALYRVNRIAPADIAAAARTLLD